MWMTSNIEGQKSRDPTSSCGKCIGLDYLVGVGVGVGGGGGGIADFG